MNYRQVAVRSNENLRLVALTDASAYTNAQHVQDRSRPITQSKLPAIYALIHKHQDALIAAIGTGQYVDLSKRASQSGQERREPVEAVLQSLQELGVTRLFLMHEEDTLNREERAKRIAQGLQNQQRAEDCRKLHILIEDQYAYYQERMPSRHDTGNKVGDKALSLPADDDGVRVLRDGRRVRFDADTNNPGSARMVEVNGDPTTLTREEIDAHRTIIEHKIMSRVNAPVDMITAEIGDMFPDLRMRHVVTGDMTTTELSGTTESGVWGEQGNMGAIAMLGAHAAEQIIGERVDMVRAKVLNALFKAVDNNDQGAIIRLSRDLEILQSVTVKAVLNGGEGTRLGITLVLREKGAAPIGTDHNFFSQTVRQLYPKEMMLPRGTLQAVVDAVNAIRNEAGNNTSVDNLKHIISNRYEREVARYEKTGGASPRNGLGGYDWFLVEGNDNTENPNVGEVTTGDYLLRNDPHPKGVYFWGLKLNVGKMRPDQINALNALGILVGNETTGEFVAMTEKLGLEKTLKALADLNVDYDTELFANSFTMVMRRDTAQAMYHRFMHVAETLFKDEELTFSARYKSRTGADGKQQPLDLADFHPVDWSTTFQGMMDARSEKDACDRVLPFMFKNKLSYGELRYLWNAFQRIMHDVGVVDFSGIWEDAGTIKLLIELHHRMTDTMATAQDDTTRVVLGHVTRAIEQGLLGNTRGLMGGITDPAQLRAEIARITDLYTAVVAREKSYMARAYRAATDDPRPGAIMHDVMIGPSGSVDPADLAAFGVSSMRNVIAGVMKLLAGTAEEDAIKKELAVLTTNLPAERVITIRSADGAVVRQVRIGAELDSLLLRNCQVPGAHIVFEGGVFAANCIFLPGFPGQPSRIPAGMVAINSIVPPLTDSATSTPVPLNDFQVVTMFKAAAKTKDGVVRLQLGSKTVLFKFKGNEADAGAVDALARGLQRVTLQSARQLGLNGSAEQLLAECGRMLALALPHHQESQIISLPIRIDDVVERTDGGMVSDGAEVTRFKRTRWEVSTVDSTRPTAIMNYAPSDGRVPNLQATPIETMWDNGDKKPRTGYEAHKTIIEGAMAKAGGYEKLVEIERQEPIIWTVGVEVPGGRSGKLSHGHPSTPVLFMTQGFIDRYGKNVPVPMAVAANQPVAVLSPARQMFHGEGSKRLVNQKVKEPLAEARVQKPLFGIDRGDVLKTREAGRGGLVGLPKPVVPKSLSSEHVSHVNNDGTVELHNNVDQPLPKPAQVQALINEILNGNYITEITRIKDALNNAPALAEVLSDILGATADSVDAFGADTFIRAWNARAAQNSLNPETLLKQCLINQVLATYHQFAPYQSRAGLVAGLTAVTNSITLIEREIDKQLISETDETRGRYAVKPDGQKLALLRGHLEQLVSWQEDYTLSIQRFEEHARRTHEMLVNDPNYVELG